MENEKNVVYESIAVIAIHMPNAEEIPFEEKHEYVMNQYRKFLNECMKIMQGNNCRDIILYNNHIYGIYERKCNKAARELETTGIRISRLARDFNRNTEEYYAEKLLCGIGIATGTAVKVAVRSPFRQDGMWMGCVFNKAYSMAQMSICDGMRRVFIDDNADVNFYNRSRCKI